MAMTLREAYKQILSDDEKKAALRKAAQAGGQATACDYIRSLGVEATDDQIAAYGASLANAQGEVADEELGAVAGGVNKQEIYISIVSFGVMCASRAINSSMSDVPRDQYPDGRLLCDDDMDVM